MDKNKQTYNRIKAVFAEKGKTNLWLAEQLWKTKQQSQNGVPTKCNQLWKVFSRLLKY